ncbi:MAG: SH3 domain-containing protein, partial [Rhodocyclaceae bacterium]|nr:SH3 domain-containing protein [Rhodocyclaceae bacterium]
GTISWIERKALSEKRTVQVTAERVAVRSAPDDKAPMAFEAVRDVVLEAVEMPKIGWIKVRHRDGATGYIHVSQVWGI